MSDPLRTLADRYRLESVLGQGAMGTVWSAWDDVVHRRVAIKEVNLPHGMPAAEVRMLAARTMREARAIGALSHPHVITLYDILMVDDRPYIVMELMQARSLSQVLKDQGPMPTGSAATIGAAVAAGLLAAHRAGITHRDVKPGNVLVGRDGRVKLTDFGIARSEDEPTMTVTGLLLGSPAYISPEVAGGAPASALSDAWGLGALLFAAVEGRPPFDRGDAIATLTSVVADPVPPHPRSGPLRPVIDGLLTKDPRSRMTVEQAHHVLQQAAAAAGDRGALRTDAPDRTRGEGTAAPRPVRSARSASEPTPWAVSAGSTPLPPPPWAAAGAGSAGAGSASLPALPTHSGTPVRHPGWLIPVAVLLAALLAVGCFYVVLELADLAGRA